MDELWALTKHSINSDLNTPLNQLMKTLTAEEKTLINNVISKLDNSTYGLNALRSYINSAYSAANAAKSNTSKLTNVQTYNSSSISVSGRGKATIIPNLSNAEALAVTIDGTRIDHIALHVTMNMGMLTMTPFSFTFESSINIYGEGINSVYAIIQTV